MANDKDDKLKQLDRIYEASAKLERSLDTISKRFENLTEAAKNAASNMSSTLRFSDELMSKSANAGESAAQDISNIVVKSAAISDQLELIKKLTDSIQDANQVQDASKNFSQLSTELYGVFENLQKTGESFEGLAAKLRNAPETTKEVSREMGILSGAIIEAFTTLNRSLSEMPKGTKEFDDFIQNLRDSFNGFSATVGSWASEFGDSFDIVNRSLSSVPSNADQLFKMLNNGLEELARQAAVGRDGVVNLFESIGKGGDVSKLQEVTKEISRLRATESFEMSSTTQPEKMLEVQEKMVEQYRKQLEIMGNILNENAGSISVDKMLEATEKMRITAQQMKLAGQNSHYANMLSENPRNINFADIGKEDQVRYTKMSAMADTASQYDPDLMYQQFLNSELGFLRRHTGGRNGLTGHSHKLNKQAGVLVAQQMSGVNFGFDATELVESAKHIQGLEYKREQIQKKYDGALSLGDKDTAKALIPEMAKIQLDIDEEAVGLEKFIPSKKDLQKLPEEVKEMVETIGTILKSAKLSNQTLLSIAVATDKEGLSETIQQLDSVNNKIKEVSESMNQSTKGFTEGIQSLQSKYNTGVGFLNNATKAMGLGSMVGIGATLQQVMGQHKSQGQLEKDMALAEFAGFGARHNNDLFNSLYESGLDSQRNTNGLIQAEDYTRQFNNYSRNIQGKYNEIDDPSAMVDFAKTSTLLQNAYGVSDSSVLQGINAFYKELKINANDVNVEFLKMGQTAEQMNIPFEKYLQQVTSLALNFRAIGIDGKNAENVISTLIRGGMSNDTAMAYAQNVGSAITRTSPGMMAYAGMMSGNYGNFYDAVAGGQMLWDKNGDVNKENVARLADSVGWYGDMMGSAFGGAGHDMIMMQSLTGQLGMNQKEASMTLSMMNDGQDLRDILSMFYNNEGAFSGDKEEITEGQQMLESALKEASVNLSGIDKSLNAYNVTMKQLAHTNEDNLRAVTDISKLIYAVGDKLTDLTDMLNTNNIALYALIAALALGGPGGIAKTVGDISKGAKNIFTGGGKGSKGVKTGSGGGRTGVPGSLPTRAARQAEEKAARGLLRKMPKIKGGGLLGLGLMGLSFAPEIFGAFGGGGDSEPSSSSWMGASSLYAANPYLNNTTTSMGAYNPYANIDSYSVNADSLGGGAGRFWQGATTVGLGALSFATGPIGWAALGAGVGTGIFGDQIFGTSEEAIMKKYGAGLDDKAQAYQDYIYQQTGGQQVDSNFSYVAAKGMNIAGDMLLNKSTDEQMQFGTAYAKAIAAGEDSNTALMTAARALEGNEKLQSIGRESVNNAIQSLVVAKESGADINTLLTDELPKNAREEKLLLEKIATVTGTKMDDLKKAIEDSGLTTAQVIAQMKQDGSMDEVEKSAEKVEKDNAEDAKIKTMIEQDMGYYKKADKEAATKAYITNKDIANASGFNDAEMKMWLATVTNQTKAGKNNDQAVDKANDYIARYRTGLDILNKGDLAGYITEWNKTDLAKELPSAHLQNGAKDAIHAFASQMGVPWETMTDYINSSGASKGLNSNDFERALKWLSNDAIINEEVNIKDPNYGILLGGFEKIETKEKKELEELNKKQEKALEYLKMIANGTATAMDNPSFDSATNAGDLAQEQLMARQQNAAATAGAAAAGVATGSGNTKDVRGTSGLTADQLNKQLGGALAGHGQDFLDAEKVSGVSAAVLAAIAMHETGNGTSKASNDSRHNVGGMMKKEGGQMSFSSISESIDYFGKYIKRKYIDDGLTSVEAIQKRYAPVGAGNDPNGLNQNWVGGVSKYWSALTGQSAPVTPTAATPAATNVTTANDGTSAYNAAAGIDFSSAYFGPMDAGVGSNTAFSGIGDVNAKTKYASNIYGRGYTTLASGMYNTQEISLAAGEASKKIEFSAAVNISADKLLNDPAFIKELTTAFEQVAAKNGAKIKKEVAEQMAKAAISKMN